MNKAYKRKYWKNKPSTETPLGAQNLNELDEAVDEIDNRVVKLDDELDETNFALQLETKRATEEESQIKKTTANQIKSSENYLNGEINNLQNDITALARMLNRLNPSAFCGNMVVSKNTKII